MGGDGNEQINPNSLQYILLPRNKKKNSIQTLHFITLHFITEYIYMLCVCSGLQFWTYKFMGNYSMLHSFAKILAQNYTLLLHDLITYDTD